MKKIERYAEKLAERFPLNQRLGVMIAILEAIREYKKQAARIARGFSWGSTASQIEKLGEDEE